MSRSLASGLAVFWSLQAFVCLAPELRQAAAGHPITASAHHAGHAGHGTPGPENAPQSDAPGSDHHHDPDGGCAQHCASLSQVVAASPASVPGPTLSPVATVPLEAACDHPRTLAAALARLELERPPPDPLARSATLRI